VTFEFDIIATNLGFKAITMLDCMIVASDLVAKRFVPVIPYNGKTHEAYFGNEEEIRGEINGEGVVFNKIRRPILSKTWHKIGGIAIWSDFFIDNLELRIIVATDDNRTFEKLFGKEIVLE
jgi:hypothetical protein